MHCHKLITEKDITMTQANSNVKFVHHMKAMAEHYTSGATHTYALPIELLHGDSSDKTALTSFAANDDDSTGTAAVDSALKACKADMNTAVDGSGAAAKASVDTLKSSNGDAAATRAFVAAMKKQEAEQQASAHKQIHKNFQKLIDTGVKHPKQQTRIMSATQLIGTFFTGLLAKVGAFFSNLATSIANFLKGIGEWIEGAYKVVTNWVSGAASSVGKFFSSIF
jgi:hypothetical protein